MYRSQGFLALKLLVLSFATSSSSTYVWPDPLIDPIEDLYVSTQFNFPLIPCSSNFPGGIGIQTAAEWLRTAYHDMATHNITTGTGGLDASIGFELDRSENVGAAFVHTLGFFAPFQTPTTSMSDLIALGAIMAVRMCSSSAINIPLRVGRVDAIQAGPTGVPLPTDTIESHTATFARQGFNATEMIGLVACGHTIGGVHAPDFPQITGAIAPNDPLDTFTFDSTFDSFDNAIATDFVSGKTEDPLIVGPNSTNSDLRIFNADGGATMKDFANSNSHFLTTCQNLIERMVNTVPNGVKLSDPVVPIGVKPQQIALQFNNDNTLSFTGNIRILSSVVDPNRKVIIHVNQRDGTKCGPCPPISATLVDGSQDSFVFGNSSTYSFNQTLSVTNGISSFTVEVRSNGKTTIADNGGHGFPVSDAVVFQSQYSCLVFGSSGISRNFTVAVRNSAQLSSLSMQWHNLTLINTLSFGFAPMSAPLVKGSALGKSGYTVYTASTAPVSAIHDFTGGTYDVAAKDSKGKPVSFTGIKMPFCFN